MHARVPDITAGVGYIAAQGDRIVKSIGDRPHGEDVAAPQQLQTALLGNIDDAALPVLIDALQAHQPRGGYRGLATCHG